MKQDSLAAHPAAAPVVRLVELLLVVLIWNTAYKGVRMLNTLHAVELGAEPFETGLLLSTYGLFPLLFAVAIGKVGDRYGVRVPLLAGIGLTACGVLLPYAWSTFTALFLSALITGTGFIFAQVSLQSLIGSLGGGAARTRNINAYALIVSTADLLGPVITGFSIDHAGHVRSYLVLTVLGVVAFALLFALRARIPDAVQGKNDRAGERMSDLLKDGRLRRIFLASGLYMAGLDLFHLFMPLYGHSVGLSASAIGLVLGAFAAAAFVTRVLLTRLTGAWGEHAVLAAAMMLAGATFVAIPLFDHAVVLGLVSFALGLGMGLAQPLTVILTYNYSPAGRAGESLGMRIAINNTAHVAVPGLFGAIGTLVGLAPVFWASGLLLAIGGWAGRAGKAAS